MRYILDNQGYIEAVSFGSTLLCNGRGCTEYKGVIPNGYTSLEDWFEIANIRAYKIESGNLVYDSDRDLELQALWEKEIYDNEKPTRAEVDLKVSQAGGLPISSVIAWNSDEEPPEGYDVIGTMEALTNMELENLINSQV
jgi:hypothetical protein